MISFKSFLTEGGAGGHVLHPFDVANNGREFLNLFDEVKKYIEKGSAGKPGSAWVKLDGINLSVRLVKNAAGKYEFALDRGTQADEDFTGITVDNLDASRLRPELQRSASILLNLLNPTIDSTMKSLDKLGLTKNPNLILNVEFVENGKSNQITYNIKNFIAIHGLRIIKYSDEIVKKTGNKKREISDYPYNVDVINAYAKALTVLLKKKNNEDDFVVLGNPEVKKTANLNFTPTLDTNLTLNGVSKSLKNWILDIDQIPKKNDRAVIFTKKVYQEIDAGDKTGLTPDQIRDYILYYATITLGTYIMNSVGSKLGKGSDQEGLMIKRENGEILKITGKFIISGLQGNFAKTESITEDLEGSFAVGVMFGRFNPPHKGHIAAWKQMAADSDLDAWYVGTNKSTIGKKDPLPSDVKEIVINTLYPNIKDHFVFEQTWLTLATYVYEKYKKDDITLICYTDEQYVLQLLKDYNDKELKDGKRYIFSNIILRPTERLSSASDLRSAVKADDKDSFSDAAGIPADLLITVGGKKIKYFDLVKSYLQNYMDEDAEPKKYFAKLSKSTSKKRSSFWKGLGTYPFTKDEYKKADKVPGDSKATRPSKYNKKYRAKFVTKESFEMGKYYEYWGWIDLEGNLVFPTKKQKDSKEDEYSHANILPGKLYEYQALNAGWLKFFIESKTPKKLDIYGYLPNSEDRIVMGVENIINSIVRGTKKDVFGENIRLPEEITWDLRSKTKDNKQNRRETVKIDNSLRRLRNSLKEPSAIKKLFRNLMLDEEKKRSITALQKKSKASGVPYSILKQVYNRGMAAWVTGHRPGAPQSAWAFARVNSFLTKGKTWYSTDADLAKKARKYLAEAHMFGYTDGGWITPQGESIRPNELDNTHTSILRRIAEMNPNTSLGRKPTETDATKKGWVRWLLDKQFNELRFNTIKWNVNDINLQKAIGSIVNKHLSAVEYSFEWRGKSGNNESIEVTDPGAFILKLSATRRKLLNEEDDYEIEMITGQLKKIADLSMKTLDIIQNKTELPAWIQDKVSVSTHNAEAIFDYYNYSEDPIQESIKIISDSIREKTDVDSTIKTILERAKQKFPKLYPKIEAAYKLADMAHEGQFRKSTGSKYIIHPMEVFDTAMNYGFTDEPTLLAAILHDVMEDGPASITFKSLSKEFGKETATTVKILSKAFSEHTDSPDKVKVDHDTYFTNLKAAPISVKNIKALDRLDNVKDIDGFSPKKLANYVPETQELLKIFGKDVPNVSADIMKRIAPYIEEYGINESIFNKTPGSKLEESIKIISETTTYSKKDGKKICFVFSNKGKKLASGCKITNIRLLSV